MSPVLFDFPPFTRLITRGTLLYDVFQNRSCDTDVRSDLPAGFPLGARLAKQPPGGAPPFGASQNLFYILHPTYSGLEPGGSGPDLFSTFEGGALGVLRCCGHDKGKVEKFMVFEYMSVNFDFKAVPKNAKKEKPLQNPPVGVAADLKAADCLVKVAARWNGTPIDFSIGSPETARGRWRYLVTRSLRTSGTSPVPFEVRINIFGTRRASQGGQNGNWTLADMDVVPLSEFPTSFTAAHELGHAMSLPDEYLNTDNEPSGFLPNLGERGRSPGQPFGFDRKGMMVSGQELVRAHSFWHIPLFAREQGYFTDAAKITVEHGPVKLTTELTPRRQNRMQFPVAQALNVDVPLAFGTGFCDQFVYVMGADEVGAGVLGGSSIANPYDGFVCVRVKMDWSFDSTTDLDDMLDMMRRADAIVTSRFNVKQHLVARGTFQGRPVRLRYLFCPRYNLHTFPTAGSAKDIYSRRHRSGAREEGQAHLRSGRRRQRDRARCARAHSRDGQQGHARRHTVRVVHRAAGRDPRGRVPVVALRQRLRPGVCAAARAQQRLDLGPGRLQDPHRSDPERDHRREAVVRMRPAPYFRTLVGSSVLAACAAAPQPAGAMHVASACEAESAHICGAGDLPRVTSREWAEAEVGRFVERAVTGTVAVAVDPGTHAVKLLPRCRLPGAYTEVRTRPGSGRLWATNRVLLLPGEVDRVACAEATHAVVAFARAAAGATGAVSFSGVLVPLPCPPATDDGLARGCVGAGSLVQRASPAPGPSSRR